MLPSVVNTPCPEIRCHYIFASLPLFASHTRYRALGLELTRVYRKSARGDLSHAPGSRLQLLSARNEVTFPAAQHHHPLAGTHFTVPRRVEG